MKIESPREQAIYDVILKSMNGGNRTFITNQEIANLLNISAFTVRDKVVKLVERKALQRLNNIWINDEFHNRVLYKVENTKHFERMDS